MLLKLNLVRILCLACVSIVLAGCGTLSDTQLDPDNSAAQRLALTGDIGAEVAGLAQPMIDSGETTGLVVGVLTPDGKQHFFGFGTTHEEGGHRPDGDTLFAVGSLSKGFLAATTSVLVQEGVLHWEDTLATLLPAEVALSDDAKRITLRQLVTHTAGLPRQPMTERTLIYFVEYLFTGKSFYRHFDRPYLLEYLSEFKSRNGGVPQYSNIGYGVLGYVLELKTGKKVAALVHEKVLDPLRLKSTGYVPQNLPGYGERALGHAGDQPKFIRRGKLVPDWQFTDIMSGSAAVYSNARDLLAYANAHLSSSGDNVLDAGLRNTLKVHYERKTEAAASAWFVDEIDGHKITHQIGLVAGYTGYIGLDEQTRTAVVVLQNNFNWTDRIGHRLLLRMAEAQKKTGGTEAAR
ncbi:serine hydrolase domain-containing protein [Pseudoduganella sp. HUAS MS19]